MLTKMTYERFYPCLLISTHQKHFWHFHNTEELNRCPGVYNDSNTKEHHV